MPGELELLCTRIDALMNCPLTHYLEDSWDTLPAATIISPRGLPPGPVPRLGRQSHSNAHTCVCDIRMHLCVCALEWLTHTLEWPTYACICVCVCVRMADTHTLEWLTHTHTHTHTHTNACVCRNGWIS